MEDGEKISLQDKILGFFRNNILISLLFFGGLIFLGGGLIQYLVHSSAPSSGVEFVSGDVKGTSTSASTDKIFIDVGGAVEKPGVYQLDSNARVQDALSAAGGLGADADRDYISKSVNLASSIRDGMKIYIPKVGEAPSQVSGASVQVLGGGSQGQVSINSASSSELEALPGIGPVTASKIISLRPYSSVEELLTKKAVGKSVFEKIKDSISL